MNSAEYWNSPGIYDNPVVQRACRKHRSIDRAIPVEYYSIDDFSYDLKAEIDRLSQMPKTSETIQRLENLKRIRTERNWSEKWFSNDARKDCKQYIRHTNFVFYWPWLPETVIVDTIFVDIYPDGKITVKLFQGHPLLFDHAESHYTEVGRNTRMKLDKIVEHNEIETYKRLM